MIKREEFLARYMENLQTVLPEEITGISNLEVLTLEALQTTMDVFESEPALDEGDINLASLLNTSESRYVINGNTEGYTQGNIVEHNFGDRARELGKGLTGFMLNPLFGFDREEKNCPILIYGETSDGYYILFAFGTRPKFDKRDGYGVGYNILTTNEIGEEIITQIRTDPSKVFNVFGTLSNDDRITPPKIDNVLYIVPLEAVEIQRVSNSSPSYRVKSGMIERGKIDISQ
jgi:hypothetical protein